MTTPLQRLYAVQPRTAWVAEEAAALPRAIPEKLVRCLWYDSRWRPPKLHTLDGQDIIVHSPGRWNTQVGPDFRQAVIAFGNGMRQRGDVEIHRYASGWTAHRHHLDARYNQVILHVLLWNDRQVVTVPRADGQTIPQVVLVTQLPRPLVAYQDDIILEDYPYKHAPLPGRCYETLRTLPVVAVQQFLEQAGATRLQQRMARWARRAASVGLAQVMYEAVFRALGATGYRQAFQQLARAVPWKDLQTCLHSVPTAARTLAAEALLLGCAGFLQQRRTLERVADEETQQYLAALHELWASFPASLMQRTWHHIDWQQPHGRPANTPERRLAGMAQFVAQYQHTTLLDVTLQPCGIPTAPADTHAGQRLCRALAGLFDVPATSYWTQHARLGRRMGKALRLIGRQRALTVVIDAVLPILLLYAQEQDSASLQASLLACYQAAPRLPDNYLLRYMARRLLGNDPTLLALVSGACQQQGVLQIFADFCDNDEGECQGCDFPLQAMT